MKHAEACGIFVAALAGHRRLLVRVPMEIVLAARDAIHVEQANVEPDRRIERPVLVNAQPCQFVVEHVGILLGGEVAILETAIGDGPADPVNELLDRILALAALDVAVEILARNDFRGQLAPRGRHFDVVLLEDGLTVVARNLRRPRFPFQLVEWMSARGGEVMLYPQTLGLLVSRGRFGRRLVLFERVFGVKFVRHYAPPCDETPTTIYSWTKWDRNQILLKSLWQQV